MGSAKKPRTDKERRDDIERRLAALEADRPIWGQPGKAWGAKNVPWGGTRPVTTEGEEQERHDG